MTTNLPVLFKKEYLIICQRIEPELIKLRSNLDDYSKLVNFLILAEDHRYYTHPGYDVIGICRAFLKDLFLGKREGASTIEQQLVRVLTGDYRFCLKRKIKEIYLATKLKNIADKYTLAAAYLDIANYGTDYRRLSLILDKYGAKLSQDMDSTICAEIVARLKYPEPREINSRRMAQIERRKKHILRLYEEKIMNKK